MRSPATPISTAIWAKSCWPRRISTSRCFVSRWRGLAKSAHVSVFVAHNDRALSLSSALANDRPRLGALDPTTTEGKAAIEQLGVKVYDTSSESVGLIGHANYATAPDVIRSIGAQLGATRKEDAGTVAVLDGEGRTVPALPPDVGALDQGPARVTATPLAPAPAATP